MPPLALIFLALPLGMFILLLMMIALQTLVSFPTWIFYIIAGFMLLYPPFLILRAVRSDIAARIFPNRAPATLFLAAAVLLNSIILATYSGAASLLVRIINSG